MPSEELVIPTPKGLYCPRADVYIDPWQPVPRALVTHAHADHLRWGCGSYLVSAEGEGVTRVRLGTEARLETLEWSEARTIGGLRVSFHPAGHILGSAQIRLEYKGQVAVVTGDYKRHHDPTTTAFELVRAHTLITESTFALPIFRWPDSAAVEREIGEWWSRNRRDGRTSVLFSYALGKAQRLLAGLPAADGPILVHGAVARLNEAYRAVGVHLPPTLPATVDHARVHRGTALVVAPPSAARTPWIRKFAPFSTAFASGWMQVRGTRRRRAGDQGFIVSDHADWNGLVATVRDSGAERVWVTHGYCDTFVRWLREHEGLDAAVLPTPWRGERPDEGDGTDDPGTDDEVRADADAAGAEP